MKLGNGQAVSQHAVEILGGQDNAAWWTTEWHPIVGCSPVSTGCTDCPVIAIGDHSTRGASLPTARAIRVRAEEFKPSGSLYARCTAPDIVRMCDSSDLFHPSVPFVVLLGVLTAVYRMPHKLFFVRTKRPELFYKLLTGLKSELRFVRSLSNLWVGTTVEDEFVFPPRVERLLAVEGDFYRWLSYEPAIGRVTSAQWDAALRTGKVGWVTSSGEVARARTRPSDPEWFETAARACTKYNVPLWHTGSGSWVKKNKPSLHMFGDVNSMYHTDYTIRGSICRKFPVDVAMFERIVANRIAKAGDTPPPVSSLPKWLRTASVGEAAG
jgi:protein gp37